MFIAKTSVRSYTGFEKVFGFVISVCMTRDSGHRNYPIPLKFGTNIYVFCETSCRVFDVHCSKGRCTRIDTITSVHYDLWKKIS